MIKRPVLAFETHLKPIEDLKNHMPLFSTVIEAFFGKFFVESLSGVKFDNLEAS